VTKDDIYEDDEQEMLAEGTDYLILARWLWKIMMHQTCFKIRYPSWLFTAIITRGPDMKARKNPFGATIGHTIILLFIMSAYSCSSNDEKVKIPEYVNKVEVSARLGPSSDLTDLNRDDVFFSIKNTGDKTIKELNGDIVFYMPEGEEAGRVSWIFVQKNDAMEKIAVGEKKKKWRPLQPGDELILGSDRTIFFAGDDRPLQEKLQPHWDSISSEIVITKLLTE